VRAFVDMASCTFSSDERLTRPGPARVIRPTYAYPSRMEIPAEVLRFVNETAEDAVKFDGDEVELAQRARNGDMTAVKELSKRLPGNRGPDRPSPAAALAASTRRCTRGDTCT
jgi:hypothetical protein